MYILKLFRLDGYDIILSRNKKVENRIVIHRRKIDGLICTLLSNKDIFNIGKCTRKLSK